MVRPALPALLIWLLLAATSAAQPGGPTRFVSEHVAMTVEADSLRVDGVYRLRFDAQAPSVVSLFYPYPDDSLLGGARTLALACRQRGEADWRPASFRELGERRGARWSLPCPDAGELEVRTTYRQARLARYARYIVTTTHIWGRPLEHASFVIYLPADVEPLEFTFPFAACADSLPGAWCYEADDFLPDRDIGVRW